MMIAIVVLFAVVCYLVVFRAYRHLDKSRAATANEKNEASLAILEKTKTNNTYLPILDVFTALDQDLVKHNMKLHADLRGYLDDGKAQR